MPDDCNENADCRLSEYNSQIVDYLLKLREQRNEIVDLIEKQKVEKAGLECDMERLAYKMTLIEKSLKQRLVALENYNMKIAEAETKYKSIVQKSESLLSLVKTDLFELDNIMNKKVGTASEDRYAKTNI